MEYLLERVGLQELNTIAAMNFGREDREQFAQLIGYSVDGFGDLSCVRPKTARRVTRAVAKFLEREAE